MRKFIKDIILTTGLYNIYRLYRKYLYYLSNSNDILDIPLAVLPYADFEYYFIKYPNLMHCCMLLYNSHKRKVKRVKARIRSFMFDFDLDNLSYFTNSCIFLTFTFTDKVLFSTSQKTRRTYVARYLKKYGSRYVANIDFGSINGREHFHALIRSDFVDYSDWSCGNLTGIRVSTFNDSAIAKYINKLSYHSVKDTCGYIIYSR